MVETSRLYDDLLEQLRKPPAWTAAQEQVNSFRAPLRALDVNATPFLIDAP